MKILNDKSIMELYMQELELAPQIAVGTGSVPFPTAGVAVACGLSSKGNLKPAFFSVLLLGQEG